MSSIGKILVVLNLILAGAFLGWAANAVSVSADYKAKFETEHKDHMVTKDSLDKELSKVRADNQQVQKDRDKLLSEKEEAVRGEARVKEELKAAQVANAGLDADVTKIRSTLETITAGKDKAVADKEKAVAAQKEAETAKAAAEESQRKAEAVASDMQSQMKKASDTIADLEKSKMSLSNDLAAKDRDMQTLVANTGAKLADYSPMPKIDAAVLEVNMAVPPGLVAINAGASKGVVVGYTFEIYDGKTYKGQARVQFVHGDMCSALITNLVKGEQIRQGDSASTRL